MKGRTMSRRRVMIEGAAVAGGLTAGALFAGCVPPPGEPPKKEVVATEPPAPAAAQITLRAHVRAGTYGQYQYDLFEEFMEQYPHIKVEGEDVPHGEASMKTELGYVAGDLPDTLHCHTRWLKIGCYKGFYLALDDLLETTDAVPDYDDFFPVMVENAKFEGRTYCIGENAHTGVGQVIMWNRHLIEKAGAEPPNPDMDMWDLQELIMKCTNPEEGIFGAQMTLSTQARLSNVIRTWGKPEYGPEGDTSSWLTSVDGRTFRFLENDGAKEFFANWVAPLLKARAHPKTEDQVQGGLFVAGKVAMFQGFLGQLRHNKLAIGDQWDFYPEDAIVLPKGRDGRIGTAQEEDSKAVYSKTKHPEEALMLLGFILSHEGGMFASETMGPWTARRSVLSDPMLVDPYPVLKDVVALWDSGIVEPYPMPWNLRDPEFSDAQNMLIDPLLQGTATWEEQAPLAQSEIQKIFDLPRP